MFSSRPAPLPPGPAGVIGPSKAFRVVLTVDTPPGVGLMTSCWRFRMASGSNSESLRCRRELLEKRRLCGSATANGRCPRTKAKPVALSASRGEAAAQAARMNVCEARNMMC
jgi:hypothetical protein